MSYLDAELLTIAEAADFLRVSRMTLYRLRERKLLPYARIGRAVRIRKSDVLRLLPMYSSQRRSANELM